MIFNHEKSIKNSLSHGFSQKKFDVVKKLKEGLDKSVYLGMFPDIYGNPLDNYYFAFRTKHGKEETLLSAGCVKTLIRAGFMYMRFFSEKK